MKTRFDLVTILSTIILSSLCGNHCKAATLIALPAGIAVRSIDEWDSNRLISATTNDGLTELQYEQERQTATFSTNDLCKNPQVAIENNNTNTHEILSFGRFCDKEAQSVSFGFLSDTQGDQEIHKIMASSTVEILSSVTDLNFIVHGGDHVDSGTKSNWMQYYKIATNSYSGAFPMVPVIGNHEYYFDSTLSQRNFIYRANENTPEYIAINRGIVTLIVLNSNILDLSEEDIITQNLWLENTLEKNSFEKKTIIVAMHHAPFSSGISMVLRPYTAEYIRSHWVPLFEKYGVKLVLSGHEHLYERLFKDNVNYIVSGPSGGNFYPQGVVSEYSRFIKNHVSTLCFFRVSQNGSISLLTYGLVEDKALSQQERAARIEIIDQAVF